MEYSQFETIRYIEEQIAGFEAILRVNSLLRVIGLSSKKIQEQKRKIAELKAQLKVIKETPTKFNRIFSDRGWVAYDSLNHQLMIEMIQLSETDSIEKAESKMLDYLSPENLRFEYLRLNALPELRRRSKFLEYAKADYAAKRYYAVVPILLMIIDGTVNDILKKGFHSDKADLDVWEAITGIDGGINKIKSIFSKGRYVTRDEPLDLPYRNGILHGTDLGYDSYLIAAKCWHFLFVVRDWALSKQSEAKRKADFEEEKKPTPLRESLKQLQRIEKEKAAIKNWKKREINQSYIDEINENDDIPKRTPEYIAKQFLSLWVKKNYGYMAKLYWAQYFPNSKPIIREIRNQFSVWPLTSYHIQSIEDEAPGISEIIVDGILEDNKVAHFKMRMLYEGEDGFAKPRDIDSGNWKLAFVTER